MDASSRGPSIPDALAPLRDALACSPAKNRRNKHNFRSCGPTSGRSGDHPCAIDAIRRASSSDISFAGIAPAVQELHVKSLPNTELHFRSSGPCFSHTDGRVFARAVDTRRACTTSGRVGLFPGEKPPKQAQFPVWRTHFRSERRSLVRDRRHPSSSFQ